MLVAQGSIVPPREIVPVLRVFAEVVPELAITEGFVVTLVEGVSKAQGSESASESDPLSTNNDGRRVGAEIVQVLQYKRVEPCAANSEVHDNGEIVRCAWSTVRIIPGHYVIVDSAGERF